MISHVSFGTRDADRARTFYDPVMAVLGLSLRDHRDGALDYVVSDFLFSLERPSDGKPASAGNGAHVAFRAVDRATVDAFHREGLAHGGRDAGAPGLRPDYDPNYYAAFLYDPDGNKLEAVTFAGATPD